MHLGGCRFPYSELLCSDGQPPPRLTLRHTRTESGMSIDSFALPESAEEVGHFLVPEKQEKFTVMAGP